MVARQQPPCPCPCQLVPAVGNAEVIFGEKVYFLEFAATSTLAELIKKTLLGLASSLHPPYSLVSEQMIDLDEYQEFVFYLEDYSGRKIALQGKDSEFPSILRYFSYSLVVHIYLFNRQGTN